MESLNTLVKKWLAEGLVDKLFTAVITLVVGILVIKAVIRLLTRALEKSKLEKAAYSLILSLVKVGLYLMLGLSLATSIGINVTGVVALASVLTLAVSLALQNILTNVLGGFTLLTTHPFHSGDYVDIGGQSGTVTQIDMSYTRLVTPDNKVICIPNSTVLASEVVNYSANDTRRAEIKVSAGYDAPPRRSSMPWPWQPQWTTPCWSPPPLPRWTATGTTPSTMCFASGQRRRTIGTCTTRSISASRIFSMNRASP